MYFYYLLGRLDDQRQKGINEIFDELDETLKEGPIRDTHTGGLFEPRRTPNRYDLRYVAPFLNEMERTFTNPPPNAKAELLAFEIRYNNVGRRVTAKLRCDEGVGCTNTIVEEVEVRMKDTPEDEPMDVDEDFTPYPRLDTQAAGVEIGGFTVERTQYARSATPHHEDTPESKPKVLLVKEMGKEEGQEEETKVDVLELTNTVCMWDDHDPTTGVSIGAPTDKVVTNLDLSAVWNFQGPICTQLSEEYQVVGLYTDELGEHLEKLFVHTGQKMEPWELPDPRRVNCLALEDFMYKISKKLGIDKRLYLSAYYDMSHLNIIRGHDHELEAIYAPHGPIHMSITQEFATAHKLTLEKAKKIENVFIGYRKLNVKEFRHPKDMSNGALRMFLCQGSADLYLDHGAGRNQLFQGFKWKSVDREKKTVHPFSFVNALMYGRADHTVSAHISKASSPQSSPLNSPPAGLPVGRRKKKWPFGKANYGRF